MTLMLDPKAPPLGLHIMTRTPASRLVRDWSPRTDLGLTVWKALPHLPADLAAELIDKIRSCVVIESSLSARVYRNLGLVGAGLLPRSELLVEEWGVVSRKQIVDAGVQFLVDAFQNTQELENFKFHGIGTGGTAEGSTQTALVTELTTEYNPNTTRATGTTTEGASANIYRSVGTNTIDSGTPAITEHGLFTAASAGTLWDRSLFSAINLVGANGDGLQTTYEATFASGG